MKKIIYWIIGTLLVVGIGYITYRYSQTPANSFVVAPAQYDFGNINKTDIMRKEFVITNWNDKPILLKNPSGSRQEINATFIDSQGQAVKRITADKNTQVIFRVELDPKKLSTDQKELELTASFNTSNVRFFSVTIPIKAKIID